MKLKDALIAWNPEIDQVRVGPLLKEGVADSTEAPIHYENTAGAAFTHVRELTGLEARCYILSEFIGLTVGDSVDLQAAHREFCKIDEYRQAIPEDVPGARPMSGPHTPADFLGAAAGLIMTMRRMIAVTDHSDHAAVVTILDAIHEHLAVAGGSIASAAEMLDIRDGFERRITEGQERVAKAAACQGNVGRA